METIVFPFSSKFLWAKCLLVFALFISTKALIKLPINGTLPALIVFGDSIVDAGNNNDLKTVIRCDFLPYGQDFAGGVPTGRFCNGKVPSDLIAEELGIKDIVPAYLDPTLKPQDLLTGVTFASGGTGYDPLTPKLASVISLGEQLNYFKEYIGKLKAIAGEEKTNFILAKSMFLVVAGSDDIANTYFVLRARKLQYDVPAYTDLMVNSAAEFVKELYGLGARKIGVFSTPPIGCVPSQRTLGGGIERACAEDYNVAALLFNKKLSSVLNSFKTSMPDGRFVYIDVYNPLLDLIQNPQKNGFEVVDNGCCGTGNIEVAILCNKLSPSTCTDVSKYIFWDSYHPTEKAYRALVTTRNAGGVCLASNKITFPALFAFGDSIVDTGNNNERFTIAKANIPPYGRDFPGGAATGRFGNGKVFSDLLAEGLRIKPLLPAYLHPVLQGEDLETGVSFASGGSGFDEFTVKLQNALSIKDQLNLFKECVRKLEGGIGQEKANATISKGLFLVSQGNNDIAITYFLFHFLYDIDAYTTQLVNSASSFIKDMYELGARKFACLSLIPLGYLPISRTFGGGFQRNSVDWLTQAAVKFNSKLEHELNHLNSNLPVTRLLYIDIYNPLVDLIQNHKKYGFEDSSHGCCGTGLIELNYGCNELLSSFTCCNSSSHVFWDAGHPSERAYRMIISQVVHNISHQLLDI
ncbi:GDSL esterase/lipase EXL1-like [Gossypium australe]|uniref:GDSL esterase/lipase EXL1-like n=1 Tax=Gossypium australe TaxID=47621 RepID=A0A5B6W4Y2_9ROSI|nr:GDSL esterase/lipase EXL1-like [Gossypium australe]